ncbi:serine hydrolase domain-containing protein [Chitinophaga sp. NPDC101104]|uniref:serine hydrolase domain-containing protein n=1 Tax=Chitinophaga sp. NPDC101104 TaxID=3390561 RepID=UPI003D01B0ED
MQLFKTLLCLLLPLGAFAQNARENQRRVENNLMPWVRFEGRAPMRFNIEERLKALEIVGVSIAVIRNYKVEWAKGYGYADKEENRPVTTETLFQAASISKSVNAVGQLKLVQQGKVDLDEDINVYLKTWHPDTSRGKITLAHLLSHTAGLSVHGFPGYEAGQPRPTVEQILQGKAPANTQKVTPLFAPGEKLEYSGGGTTVSQLILTTVTGEPYDQFMQREVLDPMGMTSSTYRQPPGPEKAKQLSSGYYRDRKRVPGKYHIYPEQAAAGLWTNPLDLSRFIIETQLSKEGKSAKVLSQAMTQKRLTPYLNEEGALGVFYTPEKKWFAHSGDNEGFSCTYYGSVEGGNGLVIMTNSDNSLIIDEIVRSIGEVYGWTDLMPHETLQPAVPSDSVKTSCPGTYKMNDQQLKIQPSGDGLVITFEQSPACKIYFTSPNTFVITELPAMFVVEKDAVVLKFRGREFRHVRQKD